jgi:excisionase family DNA binding protein
LPDTHYRPHDLLTIDEAAEEFRVDRRYLQYLRSERMVGSYKVGNRVRFRWSDLHAFLESTFTPPVDGRR